MKRTLVLQGIHAGKTVTLRCGLRQVDFVDGKLVLEGSAGDVDGMSKYLRNSYQAVPIDEVEQDSPVEPDTPTMNSLNDAQLIQALKQLNPENDDHWTAAGLPAMSAIEAILGRTDVTRAQVMTAGAQVNVGGASFTRETAAAMADGS